jgi:hypothetical protein
MTSDGKNLTMTLPKNVKVLSLAFIVALMSAAPGCTRTKSSDVEESKRDPVIVLDDWWNVDYIKNGCEMYAKEGTPCPVTLSPERIVGQFDNELKVAFASESTCHGLSLLTLSPEMIQAAVKNPSAPATGKAKTMAGAQHWSLMFDFDGHQANQSGRGWSLVDPSQHVYNGEIKTTQTLAQDICKVVSGVGGSTD